MCSALNKTVMLRQQMLVRQAKNEMIDTFNKFLSYREPQNFCSNTSKWCVIRNVTVVTNFTRKEVH